MKSFSKTLAAFVFIFLAATGMERRLYGEVHPVSLLFALVFSCAAVSLIVFSPLRKLLKQLAQVVTESRGSFYTPMKVKAGTPGDEVGLLSASFNQMFVKQRSLYRFYDQKVREFSALDRLARDTHSTLNMKEIIDSALKDVSQIMGVREAVLFLVEKENGKLTVAGSHGIPQEKEPSIQFRPGEGIAGWVAKTGEPARVNNPEADPRFRHEPAAPLSSLLCVPLKGNGATFGVLSVADKISKEPFAEDDETFLRILSSHIAIALENARLYELAITDELTGLFIYRYFMQRLEHELQRANRYGSHLSLIMLDIDHFKKLNDSYGHPAGDRVLKELAKILRETVREVDIPCRCGGEEFSIILPETDLEGTNVLAERIRTTVEETVFLLNDKPARATVSLGVAQAQESDTVSSLVQKADRALYRAKEGGRNRVRVYKKE